MSNSQRNRPAAKPRRTIVVAAVSLIAACGGSGTATPENATTETNYPPVSTFPDETAIGQNDGWAINPTADGGSVIAGGFTGTITFGDTELQSAGGIDLYVAKLDANGNWQWATSGGGPADDEAYGVTVTNSGEIAVVGYIQDTANFANEFVTSRGGSDLLVAKLDTNGNWQWATSGGGTDYDRARSIASDTEGNLYITGWYWQSAQIGPQGTTLTSVGYGDTYVAKLDTNGNWQWATSGGGTGNDQGHGIASTGDGVVISGYFRDRATFGTNQLDSTGDYDAYVAKLDTDGNWQWATSGGGAFYDRGLGLDTSEGNILLAGFFYGDATFGANQLRSAGDGDIFVAEIDSDGNWRWAARAGSFDYDEAYTAVYTPDGTIAVYGSIGGATAEFGALTATSAGSDDIFVAEIDSDGNWQWVLRAGGPNRDEGYAMTVGTDGDLLVTGTFRDQVQFDSISVTASAGSDVFVARVGGDGTWNWVSTASSDSSDSSDS